MAKKLMLGKDINIQTRQDSYHECESKIEDSRIICLIVNRRLDTSMEIPHHATKLTGMRFPDG